MNQSYIGLVLILIVVCVYTFYSSSVSDMKDKRGFSKESNLHVKWRNVLESNQEVFVDDIAEEISKNNLSEMTLGQSSSLFKVEENQKQRDEITFNICCGLDQVIDTTSNACIDVEDTGTSNRVDYLLHTFVVNSNMGQGLINYSNFVYGFALINGCVNSDIIRFEWTKNKTNFYFIDQESGNLLEVNYKTRKISSIFSTRAYCLDQSIKNGTYVALVCPCTEKSCVPKCCQKSFYFNTIENTCKHEAEDDIQSYSPDLYNNPNNNEEIEAENYYLIHRKPECNNQKLFIESELDIRPLYVQENGSLLVPFKENKYYYFDSKKYCVDMFSRGRENQTFVNGFYCATDEESSTLTTKEPSTSLNWRDIREEFLLFVNISNSQIQQGDYSSLNRSKILNNQQFPNRLLTVQDGRSCDKKTEKITLSLAFEMICMAVLNHLIVKT